MSFMRDTIDNEVDLSAHKYNKIHNALKDKGYKSFVTALECPGLFLNK